MSNTRFLLNKINEFSTDLKKKDLDMAAVSETWFTLYML